MIAFATSVAVSVDTGWTANSSGGDKTAVVTNYAAGISGAMITALNTVSAGLGTALSALDTQMVLNTKKIQALETALSTNKLPNA